jgi:2-polyprenyl-6-methoxyphenol hydroxylase-like FAD-dependent oxidoreductase
MQARYRSYVRLSACRVAKSTYTYNSTSCEGVDYETGTVTFENGRVVSADLIVGADGIRVSPYSISSDIYMAR